MISNYTSSLSLEEFLNEIALNSSLRLKLLNDLNTLAHNEDLDKSCRFHHIRSNIPTLYAQYEGFVRFSFNLIPLYINSFDKSSFKVKDFYFSLYIALNMINCKDINFIKLLGKINTCTNNFVNENINFFHNFQIGSLIIQHDKNFYEFLRLFEFDPCVVSEFERLNFKIKTFYKRRNSIIHGDINNEDCSVFHLIDNLCETHLKNVLTEWDEEYECIKNIITLLKNELYNWATEKNFIVT